MKVSFLAAQIITVNKTELWWALKQHVSAHVLRKMSLCLTPSLSCFNGYNLYSYHTIIQSDVQLKY